MYAMMDLTELTGIKADSDRQTTISGFTIPTAWLKPGAIGLVSGLLFFGALALIFGSLGMLMLGFLGPIPAIYLFVDDTEAPWKRAVRKVQSTDGKFLSCGRVIDMHSRDFVRTVPSSTTNFGDIQ